MQDRWSRTAQAGRLCHMRKGPHGSLAPGWMLGLALSWEEPR